MSNIKFIKIGADGQQLPSDATDWVAVELALLADSTRYSPAIDIAFFRDFKEGWYWSKTRLVFGALGFRARVERPFLRPRH